MDHTTEQDQEHGVYGEEIPTEAEIDTDFEVSNDKADDPEHSNCKELEDMKKRLKEIEEEAGVLREMLAEVEKEMGSAQGGVITDKEAFKILVATGKEVVAYGVDDRTIKGEGVL